MAVISTHRQNTKSIAFQSPFWVLAKSDCSGWPESRHGGTNPETNMGQADRVHPGRNWLCCGSGKYLEIPLSLLPKRRRWEAKLATCLYNDANEETCIIKLCLLCNLMSVIKKGFKFSNYKNYCRRLMISDCAIVRETELVIQSPIIPHMLAKWRYYLFFFFFTRCISGALFNHAGVFGDASVIHGVNCGSISEERSSSSPGCGLPTA